LRLLGCKPRALLHNGSMLCVSFFSVNLFENEGHAPHLFKSFLKGLLIRCRFAEPVLIGNRKEPLLLHLRAYADGLEAYLQSKDVAEPFGFAFRGP
jgi:hypothetical protein